MIELEDAVSDVLVVGSVEESYTVVEKYPVLRDTVDE